MPLLIHYRYNLFSAETSIYLANVEIEIFYMTNNNQMYMIIVQSKVIFPYLYQFYDVGRAETAKVLDTPLQYHCHP